MTDTVPAAAALSSPSAAPAVPAERPSLLEGPDGRRRCAWVGSDPNYQAYHDDEWGHPVRGEQALFERVALEAFQSGLSWITILKRREAFRAAFAGFDPAVVAAFGAADVERLLGDAGIIRNRLKVESTIANARALLSWHEAQPDALDSLIWSFASDEARRRPRTLAEVPATTESSHELSRALKARGFRFVGPTTMYALLQAVGVVDDHVVGCWRAE